MICFDAENERQVLAWKSSLEWVWSLKWTARANLTFQNIPLLLCLINYIRNFSRINQNLCRKHRIRCSWSPFAKKHVGTMFDCYLYFKVFLISRLRAQIGRTVAITVSSLIKVVSILDRCISNREFRPSRMHDVREFLSRMLGNVDQTNGLSPEVIG